MLKTLDIFTGFFFKWVMHSSWSDPQSVWASDETDWWIYAHICFLDIRPKTHSRASDRREWLADGMIWPIWLIYFCVCLRVLVRACAAMLWMLHFESRVARHHRWSFMTYLKYHVTWSDMVMRFGLMIDFSLSVIHKGCVPFPFPMFMPVSIFDGFRFWISATCVWIGSFPTDVILVLPQEHLPSVSICLTLTSHYRIISLLLSVISSLDLAFPLFCSFHLFPSHHLSLTSLCS